MSRQATLRRVTAWWIRMSAAEVAQRVLFPSRFVASKCVRDLEGDFAFKASVENQSTGKDEFFARGRTERRASLMLLRRVCEETIRRIDKELAR